MRPEGKGRRAVRRIWPSTSCSITSFKAAVPPETKADPEQGMKEIPDGK